MSNIETMSKPDIDEMMNAAGGKKSMSDIAKMLSSMDPENVANVNRLANKLNDPTLSDKWLEAWINGLLSGPQTHVVNVLSNMLTTAEYLDELDEPTDEELLEIEIAQENINEAK